MRRFFPGRAKRPGQDEEDAGISTPPSSRNPFPSGIKLLYAAENSVVEYVRSFSIHESLRTGCLGRSRARRDRRFPYPGYRRYLLTSGHLTSILFVHGLTGDREKTWTAKNTSEPWPRTLLPSKVPNARVLTFGYDAYVADWRGLVSQVRIGNHAMNLLTTLASYREDDDTVRLIYSYLLGKLTSYGAEQPPDHICLP
jgi:hypothetical protein